MELRDILNTVAERLPDQLDALLTYAGALIPADIDVLSVLKLIGVLAVVSISRNVAQGVDALLYAVCYCYHFSEVLSVRRIFAG